MTKQDKRGKVKAAEKITKSSPVKVSDKVTKISPIKAAHKVKTSVVKINKTSAVKNRNRISSAINANTKVKRPPTNGNIKVNNNKDEKLKSSNDKIKRKHKRKAVAQQDITAEDKVDGQNEVTIHQVNNRPQTQKGASTMPSLAEIDQPDSAMTESRLIGQSFMTSSSSVSDPVTSQKEDNFTSLNSNKSSSAVTSQSDISPPIPAGNMTSPSVVMSQSSQSKPMPHIQPDTLHMSDSNVPEKVIGRKCDQCCHTVNGTGTASGGYYGMSQLAALLSKPQSPPDIAHLKVISVTSEGQTVNTEVNGTENENNTTYNIATSDSKSSSCKSQLSNKEEHKCIQVSSNVKEHVKIHKIRNLQVSNDRDTVKRTADSKYVNE